MNRTLAATLTAVVLSACGTTVVYAPLAQSPRKLASRAPATVELYEQDPPTRAFVVVGTISTHPDSMYTESELTPKLVDEMRREAARVGCDALVMQGSSPAPSSTLGGRAIASVSYRASCVMFSPDPVAAVPSTASR